MNANAVLWYAVVGLCSYLLLLLQQALYRRLARLPPGPLGLPVFGNLLQLGSKPNESLQRLSSKYGELMSLFVGSKTLIVVSSPAMAREVYKTHDKVLAGRDPGETSKVMGHYKRALIFGQPGQHWQMLRKISNTEVFSPRKLASLAHLRSSVIAETVCRIYAKSRHPTPLNVRETLLRYSLNLLGKVVFSRDMFHPDSASFHDFLESLHILTVRSAAQNIVDFLPWLRWLDPQHIVRDVQIYRKRVDGILEKLIQERLAQSCQNQQSTAEKDFLDTLLDLRDDSQFTLTDIKIYLSDLFAAGTDTTMITLEWAIAELLRNPHKRQKLQAEIDETIGRERLLEESDIEKLPYLQAVVKETLRLHPAAPLLVPHRAESGCEMGGYVIPKDARIVINYWAISRDPSLWEKPCEFIPERFLEKSRNMDFRGENFEFIPFGGGRRICLGLPLANVIIHSLLGALIQSFNWSMPLQETDMSDKFGVTMHKARTLQAFPSPRFPLSHFCK